MDLSLFVYGSLRPGQSNYAQLAESVLASQTCSIPGQLRLRPEGYPALVLPHSLPRVLGRVYDWTLPPWPAFTSAPVLGSVDGEILRLRDSEALRRRLDDFEGFSDAAVDYLRVAFAWQGQWLWTYTAPEPVPDWPIIECWPLDRREIAPWRP